MTPAQEMSVHAADGRLALQWCGACETLQYPPRELCAACLADALTWRVTDAAVGEILAATLLHHSHTAEFRTRLPLKVGLVRLDAGPTVVCFLAEGCAAGHRVRVTACCDHQGRAVLTADRCAVTPPAALPPAAKAAPFR